MYKKLVEYHKEGELSFKYVTTFNMDEYVDLPRDHPESYHSFMWTNFFKHIDIDPKNAHIPDGNVDELDVECQNYEKAIKEAGGVHLFIGGMFYSFFFNSAFSLLQNVSVAILILQLHCAPFLFFTKLSMFMLLVILNGGKSLIGFFTFPVSKHVINIAHFWFNFLFEHIL